MLRAFFDEASDNTNDFLMGGWLASFEEWEKFSDAWDTELKFPPSINYFNHNEALGLKDEFEGWNEAARDEKMMALAGVIARHDLTGLIGEIKIPQLHALFAHSIVPKRTLRSIVKFTEPYHFACQCAVSVTLGHQVERVKNLTDRVDFIFDEGVPFLADIIGNYPRLKEILPPKAVAIAGTIISGNDRHITALQAADFLAGQELLKLRIGMIPRPLSIMGLERINKFSCHGEAAEKIIPRAVSKLNVIWATKRLVKIQDGKKRKDAWKNKK
jgi:hypothetical protein